MSQRLKIFVILTSWLFASGSQWDVMQVFAWSRMFAGYSTTMSVSAAVERTFSGETCEICRAVRHAKDEEQKSIPATDLAKLKVVLVCPPLPRFVVAQPAQPTWSSRECEPLSAGRPAPPVPPPRVA